MAAVANLDALRGEFHCPISFELMRDPVREGGCGHVFERRWIEEWVAVHRNCPLSRSPLALEALRGHDTIRNACTLLDPARVEPLTAEQLEFIQGAARALRERREDDAVRIPPIPRRVDQAAHDSILARLAQFAAASTRAATDYYCN